MTRESSEVMEELRLICILMEDLLVEAEAHRRVVYNRPVADWQQRFLLLSRRWREVAREGLDALQSLPSSST